MHVHFIAIGGAVMHNLAIALLKKGYKITGSDDEIFEPSKSRLKKYGLLPQKWGWNSEKITADIDIVILGMHAKEDNPELIQAQKLGIKIYSFPEFLYEQTKNKTRIVIAGSHGKTTITSMIMDVLKKQEIKFDYMVGSMIEGFETMVGLYDESKLAVFEGDEYLTSAIDKRPKFLLYKPHIVLISGLAWDHFNVFPDFDIYKQQFIDLIRSLSQKSKLIFDSEDEDLKSIIKENTTIDLLPYSTPDYKILNRVSELHTDDNKTVKLQIFGRHNMKNLNGARIVCNELQITNQDFYRAISNFTGAAKRLQKIREREDFTVYLDFAHSPSKVRATTEAIREKYPNRHLIAFLELHTYSSLNKKFISNYKNALKFADFAVVYYNPKVIENKGLEKLNEKNILDAFNKKELVVIDNKNELKKQVRGIKKYKTVVIFMSSGNFSNINIESLLND